MIYTACLFAHSGAPAWARHGPACAHVVVVGYARTLSVIDRCLSGRRVLSIGRFDRFGARDGSNPWQTSRCSRMLTIHVPAGLGRPGLARLYPRDGPRSNPARRNLKRHLRGLHIRIAGCSSSALRARLAGLWLWTARLPRALSQGIRSPTGLVHRPNPDLKSNTTHFSNRRNYRRPGGIVSLVTASHVNPSNTPAAPQHLHAAAAQTPNQARRQTTRDRIIQTW